MQEIRDVPQLPNRDLAGHKGTFGTVLVIAGQRGMLGAAILCVRGALRGGAGLVRACVPEPCQDSLAVAVPSATSVPRPATTAKEFDRLTAQAGPALLGDVDAVVIGPGLGRDAETEILVRWLMAQVEGKPVVVDADGLNALSPLSAKQPPKQDLLDAPHQAIWTPHPTEAARLLDSSTRAVQADRRAAAEALAERTSGVVVLKGAGTLVCDGTRIFENDSGNPGMGTGGCGDVLAGLLGALLAQGMTPFDAACYGVNAHGCAGDLVAARSSMTGLIADDLPAALAEVLEP